MVTVCFKTKRGGKEWTELWGMQKAALLGPGPRPLLTSPAPERCFDTGLTDWTSAKFSTQILWIFLG